MNQISSDGPFSYLKNFKEILLIGAGVGVIPLLSTVSYMATCALWRAREMENRERVEIKIRIILSMRD
jgi:ferredoxin-NADP reductase